MPNPNPLPFVRKLPAEQQQLLRETVFGPDSPGSVVQDLQTLVKFIGEQGVKAGGKHQVLPIEVLTELNLLMRWQARVELRRPFFRSYPNLQGLHLLARATGLIVVRGAASKARLVADPVAFGNWKQLNDTERYFSLLNAWLIHARSGIIGERPPIARILLVDDGFLAYLFQLWERVGSQGTTISEKQRADNNFSSPIDYDRYSLVLMAQFGLVRIEQGPPIEGRPWIPVSVQRTAFGGAVVSVLEQLNGARTFLEDLLSSGIIPKDLLKGTGERPGGDDEAEAQEQGDADGQSQASGEADEDPASTDVSADGEPLADTELCFNELQPLFAPYVPAWQKSLCVNGGGEFRDGVFIFKALMGKGVWRRIAAPADATLTGLADAVLDAFDFEGDHLWSFHFRDRFGNSVGLPREHAAAGGTDLTSSAVRVGEVPLEVGDSMMFLFDYGDNWRFDLRLERIDPPGKSRAKQPKLLDQRGKAPVQYPSWD